MMTIKNHHAQLMIQIIVGYVLGVVLNGFRHGNGLSDFQE